MQEEEEDFYFVTIIDPDSSPPELSYQRADIHPGYLGPQRYTF